MVINIDDLKITSYSGRNVGDIYYTLRNDETLNGAIECQGAEFNADDFASYDLTQNPYKLCINGYIPYVSYSEYEQQIALHGCCASFAVDSQLQRFRVPTIKDVHIQPGDAESLAQYLGQQLPNLKGNFWTVGANNPDKLLFTAKVNTSGNLFDHSGKGGSGKSTRYYFDASLYDSTYTDNGTVRPNSIVLRAMIQLIVPQSQENSDDDDGGGGTEQENLRMPYLHIPGTAAKATEINANFEYLRTRIQKLLKNSAFVDMTSEQYIEGKKHFNQSISIYDGLKINTDKDSTSGGHLDFCYRGSSVTSQIWEKESGYLALDKNPKDNSSDTSIATTKWVSSFVNSNFPVKFGGYFLDIGTGITELDSPCIAYNWSRDIQVMQRLDYYIPSDGYQYLLLVGNTTTKAVTIATDILGSIDGKKGIRIYNGTTFVPIGTGRRIYTSLGCTIYGYIRLGKV